MGDMKAEPLQPASLGRHLAARNHTARGTDGDLADVLARDTTRLVFADHGYLLVAAGSLCTMGPDEYLAQASTITGTRIYLGLDQGVDYVGIGLDQAGRDALDAHLDVHHSLDAEDMLDAPASGLHSVRPHWVDLGSLAEELSDLDVGLACALVAVNNWHMSHTHSPRNGLPTTPVAGGWVRRDPTTGSEHFPRTDPAVIMAVVHTDSAGVERLLLGNNALWEPNRYSLLAGFVEPGETLERAVVREVFEEASVVCHSPVYVGSQPWPFPSSLMLGFFATAESRDARPDRDEMAGLRWVTRKELLAERAAGTMRLPGTVSIAGQIIESWLAGDR